MAGSRAVTTHLLVTLFCQHPACAGGSTPKETNRLGSAHLILCICPEEERGFNAAGELYQLIHEATPNTAQRAVYLSGVQVIVTSARLRACAP